MIASRLLAVVSSSLILLFAGAAVAGNTQAEAAQLMDFVPSSNTLFAFPRGGALGLFQHTDQTLHLLGSISHNPHGVPPNPCDGLTHAWNLYATQRSPAARRVQLVILSVMSEARCSAVLVTDPTTTPPTLVSIQPTGS